MHYERITNNNLLIIITNKTSETPVKHGHLEERYIVRLVA